MAPGVSMRSISEFPVAVTAEYQVPTDVPLYPHPFGEMAPWYGQQFRCSVKNSFLHFSDQMKQDEPAEKDGSSQRSSSVPSRFLEEHMDDWHRRNPEHRIEREQEETDWSVAHPDLGALDFNWGAPQSRPEIPQGMFTTDNEPTRGPLAAALAAARYI
jgi:hypothetical protein